MCDVTMSSSFNVCVCVSSYLDLSNVGMILPLDDSEVHRQGRIEQRVVVINIRYHDVHCRTGGLNTHPNSVLVFWLAYCNQFIL